MSCDWHFRGLLARLIFIAYLYLGISTRLHPASLVARESADAVHEEQALSEAWCSEFGAKRSGWHWWTDCECKEGFALITRSDVPRDLQGQTCAKALHRVFSYKYNPKVCTCAKMETVCQIASPSDQGQSYKQEVEFDAGHTGLVISTSEGKVLKAPSRESQGGRKGVAADWQILEIDGKPFSEDLLHVGGDEVCHEVDYRGQGKKIACKSLTVDKTTTIKLKVTPRKYCFAPENIQKARTEPRAGEPQIKYDMYISWNTGKCSLPCKALNLTLTDADGKDHRSIGSNHWATRRDPDDHDDFDLDDDY